MEIAIILIAIVVVGPTVLSLLGAMFSGLWFLGVVALDRPPKAPKPERERWTWAQWKREREEWKAKQKLLKQQRSNTK